LGSGETWQIDLDVNRGKISVIKSEQVDSSTFFSLPIIHYFWLGVFDFQGCFQFFFRVNERSESKSSLPGLPGLPGFYSTG
jgi:hypothetical protein